MATPTLPEELLSEIISYFDTNPRDINEPGLRAIARYSTVSKQWASLVERITFRHLNLSLLRLSEFARIVTGRRRQFVRSINLQMLLYCPEKEELDVREMLEQEAAYDMTFTLMVQKLFTILNSWTGYQPREHSRGINLLLSTYSPSLDERERQHDQFNPSFVRFHPELLKTMGSLVPKLANVYCVTELRTYAYSSKFWPSSMVQIAASLPNLYRFDAELCDSVQSTQVRLQARKEFAEHLCFLPTTCRELYLTYFYEIAVDASHENLPLLSLGQTLEPFSASLVDLSYRLVSLHLESAIFDIVAFMQKPSRNWPYLALLQLTLAPITPNGEWYFDRDMQPAFDDVEESDNESLRQRIYGRLDYRRSLPRRGLLNEVYETVAKFVRRMPCLEALYLQFDLAGTGAQRLPCHGFEYSPRKTSEPPEEDDSEATAEIEWACLPPFEPDQTVLQAWQDTAVLLGRELSVGFRNPRASPSITVEEVRRHGEEHIELIAENSAIMRADNELTA